MALLKHSFVYLVLIFLTRVFAVLANVASYWTKKLINNSRETCLLTLKHGQYMGNNRKQLFLDTKLYHSLTCFICNSVEPQTSLHIILNCRESCIHDLRRERHNKAVWAVRELPIQSKHYRCYILMNVATFIDNPSRNTVPVWVLLCTCSLQRCHRNARCKLDVICIKGLPYQTNPPITLERNLKIQFIEFPNWNDRSSTGILIRTITEKYVALMENITNNAIFNYFWTIR